VEISLTKQREEKEATDFKFAEQSQKMEEMDD